MSLLKRIVTAKRFGAASAFFGAVCLSLLLFVWPKFQSYRQSFLVYSSLNGSISKMKLSLVLGADANEAECEAANCWTPLVAAAAANQPEAVQLLLERGADVNKKLKRGQTALMIASYHGDTELVRLLISSGADVNVDCEGDTALSWARQKNHAEIISLLVAAGATR
jgi:hypothetical protein